MEQCPFCGGQIISCDCPYKLLNLFDSTRYTQATEYLPPEIYSKGLSEQQEQQWITLLIQKGRIPWIEYPLMCARCGTLWPDFFRVPDEEWKHYIQPSKQRSIICLTCYETIKHLIDDYSDLPKPKLPEPKTA